MAGVIDQESGDLVTIDEVHERVHSGRMFTGSLYSSAVANNASVDVLIKAGEETHLRPDATCGGDTELLIFEAPTTSADGTPIPLRNRNRNSANAPTTQMFSGPTVTGTGLTLLDTLVPAWTHAQVFEEWDLKEGTNYIVRVTNRSGGAANIGVLLHVYQSFADEGVKP